jgi:hypothetical protein
MGNACDPAPGIIPSGDCDGINDPSEGYADGDGDGWGDPCDFQPVRSDSYPGAPELCDGRDNDGDALFAPGELTDQDGDHGIACGDCDETDSAVHACACEVCSNLFDDDCDGQQDGSDTDCVESSNCILLTVGPGEPDLILARGACGGAQPDGPFDVIRGDLGQLQFSGGSVDLGRVTCVEDDLVWDQVTDVSGDPSPACDPVPAVFYLAKDATATDFGAASSGERRDMMDPAGGCP